MKDFRVAWSCTKWGIMTLLFLQAKYSLQWCIIIQSSKRWWHTHAHTDKSMIFFCGRSMRHTWFHSRLIRLYTAQKVRRNANFAISSDNIFFEKIIWYALKCRFLAWLSCKMPKKWEEMRISLFHRKSFFRKIDFVCLEMPFSRLIKLYTAQKVRKKASFATFRENKQNEFCTGRSYLA